MFEFKLPAALNLDHLKAALHSRRLQLYFVVFCLVITMSFTFIALFKTTAFSFYPPIRLLVESLASTFPPIGF